MGDLELEAAARADAAVAALRTRFRPVVERRVAVLEAYLAGEATRLEASRCAHQLAGSLGSYGWAEGSRLARRLDLALDGDQPVRLPPEELAETVASLHEAVGLGG